MKYVYFILLIFVMSYREVQILIDRKSWQAIDHLNIFWYTDQNAEWWISQRDSFHVSNGLIVLIMVYLFTTSMSLTFNIIKNKTLNLTIHVAVYWVIFMQLRNLFMEIL